MDIFGIPARDFAAYWGAGLATLLAAAKLLHPRPVVILDFVRPTAGSADARLTITNPANYPVMLTSIWVPEFIGGKVAMQTGSIDGWKTIDVVRHVMAGKLHVLIAPGATAKIHFTTEADPPGSLMFVLNWRSHRAVAWPMFPTVIYRGRKAVSALADHPVHDLEL